jgi:hypothetical protein
MNKKWLVLYILFTTYSLFSMTAGRDVTLNFMELFTFEGDLLLVMIFNMLGVFPIYYLLVVLRYEKQKFYVYVLFALGFLSGAFSIIPGLLLLKGKKKVLSKRQHTLFIVLPMLLVVMLLVGFIGGNLSNYVTLFLEDQFVHIMTIDLIVLILIPYFDGATSVPFLHLTKWQTS